MVKWTHKHAGEFTTSTKIELSIFTFTEVMEKFKKLNNFGRHCIHYVFDSVWY